VRGCAPHDLSAPIVDEGASARLEFVVTLGTRLITRGRRPVATVTIRVTASGRAGTACDGLTALARVGGTRVAHEVMQATVPSRLEVAIACPLVHHGGSLIFAGHGFISIGRGLLAVRPRLFPIRESLFTVSVLLIVS
jgi:hypothetical protein